MLLKRFPLTALLLAALLPAWAGAQTAYKSSTTSTSACTGDKIQLSGFSISPAAPAANQSVTIKVDLKNLCGQTMSIPFKIADGSTVLNSGTKSVSANQTATVQYTWTATAGSHSLDAYLDSGNTLNESSSYLANNGASSVITLSIAAPVLETVHIQKDPAQQAGAQFNLNLDQGTGCTVKRLDGGTLTNVPIILVALEGAPPCGAATFEAFANFTLKNGWKVKSVTVKSAGTNTGNAAWEWVTRPVEGSSTPFAKLRCKTTDSMLPFKCLNYLYIQIEGPKGTSPY